MTNKKDLVLMPGIGKDSTYVPKTMQIEQGVMDRLNRCFDDNGVYRTKIVLNSLLDAALKELGY